MRENAIIRSRKASDKFIQGDEVRAWRLSRGVTQIALGRWLGLSPTAVGKYEKRGATRATALALSAIDKGLRPYRATDVDLKAAKDIIEKENQ